MFGSVVTKIMEFGIGRFGPTSNINAFASVEQPGSPDVVFSRPASGPMHILAIPGQPLDPTHIQYEKETDCRDTATRNRQQAQLCGNPDTRVLRSGITQDPN